MYGDLQRSCHSALLESTDAHLQMTHERYHGIDRLVHLFFDFTVP